MKTWLWAIIFFAAAMPAQANSAYHDSILEWQLRDYSDAYRAFYQDRQKRYSQLTLETQLLVEKSNRIVQEYENLKVRIEDQAQDNVQQAKYVKKLEASKTKLREELEQKSAEYEELAAVLNVKRAEIIKMRGEISRGERYFNEELLNFYKDEEKRLSDKIENCRKRQDELRQKIDEQSTGS